MKIIKPPTKNVTTTKERLYGHGNRRYYRRFKPSGPYIEISREEFEIAMAKMLIRKSSKCKNADRVYLFLRGKKEKLFTDEDILRIIQVKDTKKLTNKELADLYRCSESTIKKVLQGKY